VIRRINADFVALALRAPLINNPPAVADPDERWLYERVSRAKMAPQGIAVLNSAGQVLAWTQMFDSDQSVHAFFDRAATRAREQSDPRAPVTTERYLHFPSERLADLHDDAKVPSAVAGHARGRACAGEGGKEPAPSGSLRAWLVGRALDERGKPLGDTVKQEHYVEDQFSLPPDLQRLTTQALARAVTEHVRLPLEFSKLCAGHAHLGHLDVQPCLCMIPGQAENQGAWKRCEFLATKHSTTSNGVVWHIQGQSKVVSELAINGRGFHNVALRWEGYLTVEGDRITHLMLSARGAEQLEFAKDAHPLKDSKRDEVAFLPAGRPIDVSCGVRYGIIGESMEPAPARNPRSSSSR
jgi:hypothetical protein